MWVVLDAMIGLKESARERLKKLAGHRLTAAGEIHIIAETERTQEGNRQAVMDRLRILLMQALAEPKRRRKTKPSKGSKERRLSSKKKRGEVKSMRRGGDREG